MSKAFIGTPSRNASFSARKQYNARTPSHEPGTSQCNTATQARWQTASNTSLDYSCQLPQQVPKNENRGEPRPSIKTHERRRCSSRPRQSLGFWLSYREAYHFRVQVFTESPRQSWESWWQVYTLLQTG